MGLQTPRENHTGYVSGVTERQVRRLPALNVGTFIRTLITKKGVFRKRVDQVCPKEVSSGLSSMKCFSEGLGRRKFSGVREVNREVRKKKGKDFFKT